MWCALESFFAVSHRLCHLGRRLGHRSTLIDAADAGAGAAAAAAAAAAVVPFAAVAITAVGDSRSVSVLSASPGGVGIRKLDIMRLYSSCRHL